MDKLIERNKSYRQLIHTNDIMKLQKSSERHNKKMFEEQQKLEEKALKNQEKSFKKYVTFYFYATKKVCSLFRPHTQGSNFLFRFKFFFANSA